MQVLLNLLSNAVKFTPTNGHIDVKVRLIPEQGSKRAKLEVSVADNGTGIK